MTSKLLGSLYQKVGAQVPQKATRGFMRHASTSAIPVHVLNTPATRITKLSNGIRVATEEWAGETCSVGVFINAGSGIEDEKTNGVAHFLEHMAFKGTATRSQKKLETEIENIGAHLNAYTSREHTVYFAKSFKTDTPKMVEILGDILQNASFTKEAVESERSTILRESEEVENNMEESIFDHLHSAAFQGTPLGRPILGSRKNIESIQRDDLINYIQKYYTAPQMVVVGSGAVKHEELCAQVEKVFTKVSKEDNVAPELRTDSVEFTGSEIRIRNDDMPLVHVAIGVEGVSWVNPDYFVMVLIQTIIGCWDHTLGGGNNLASRLCELIATENLCHSMTSFQSNYINSAIVGNTFIAPPGRVDDLTYEILNEWQRLGHGVTPNEVERAKNKLKANTLMQLDGNTAIMENIGRQLLTIGRVMSPAEIFQRISDITVADVKRVATTYLTDVSPAVVAMGPVEFMPDYNTIRSWTYWNRM